MCPFTENSSQGFGSRLGSSLTGLLIGPLLVIGAIVLLWWNEGRAVQGLDIAVACRARRYVRAWHTFDDQFPPPLHHRHVSLVDGICGWGRPA